MDSKIIKNVVHMNVPIIVMKYIRTDDISSLNDTGFFFCNCAVVSSLILQQQKPYENEESERIPFFESLCDSTYTFHVHFVH